MQSAPGSVRCSPCRLAAPPTVEQAPGEQPPGDTPDPAPTGLIRDRLGSEPMTLATRADSPGSARSPPGARSWWETTFFEASIVSLCVGDADGWFLGDGGSCGPRDPRSTSLRRVESITAVRTDVRTFVVQWPRGSAAGGSNSDSDTDRQEGL